MGNITFSAWQEEHKAELAGRVPAVIPELDYRDVLANSVVMAGLDPAIQSMTRLPCVFLDGRVRPGHDR